MRASVIAGLAKVSSGTTTTGIAGLSQIPALGHLFRKDSVDKDESQVLILLKPRLLIAPASERPAEGFWIGPLAVPGALIGAFLYPLGLDGWVWSYLGLGIDFILWAARWIGSLPGATCSVVVPLNTEAGRSPASSWMKGPQPFSGLPMFDRKPASPSYS